MKTKSQIDHINLTLARFRGHCVHEWETDGEYWTCSLCHAIDGYDFEEFHGHSCFPERVCDNECSLPNFYSDLNLLHEVELKLSDTKFAYGQYLDQLRIKIVKEFKGTDCFSFESEMNRASANIRAEALCEVITGMDDSVCKQ